MATKKPNEQKAPKPAKEKKVAEKVAKSVYEALFNFQNENVTIARNGEGNINGRKYAYATLDDTINGIRPLMMKHKLVFTQVANAQELETKLYHIPSETEISGKLPLGNPQSSQDLGSRLTYLRRYALTSMLGLSLEQDVDGLQAGKDAPKAAPVAPQNTVPAQQGGVLNNASANQAQKVEDAKAELTNAEASASAPESPYFTKAKAMIESCTNEDGINLLTSQVKGSMNLSDSEKSVLHGVILEQEKKIGIVRVD